MGLVARGDKTGIAVQCWNFWRNMDVTSVLLVDLTRYHHPLDPSLYDGTPNLFTWDAPHFLQVASHPEDILDNFLSTIDVLFCVETPYNYWLFERAFELGVRTIVQPNYEFFDYSGNRTDIAKPDLFALPTAWHEDDYRRELPDSDIRVVPVPVDTQLLTPKLRTRFTSLLHTAGTVAEPDRNGTQILIEAMRRVKSPITARVCYQPLHGKLPIHDMPSNITIDDSAPRGYWELYGDEDIYVMPRRWGGLCLPMQESIACGMPPVMSGVSPQDGMLPPELQVPAFAHGTLPCRVPVDMYETDPQLLANKLDVLYEQNDLVEEMSQWCAGWAESHSWEALRPLYQDILEG